MDTVHLGQLMKDHPNFASLGAIGPDLFFFLPDFRDIKKIETSSIQVVDRPKPHLAADAPCYWSRPTLTAPAMTQQPRGPRGYGGFVMLTPSR